MAEPAGFSAKISFRHSFESVWVLCSAFYTELKCMAKIIINLNKIAHNLETASALCKKCGVELVVVTKCCGPDNVILKHIIEAGARSIAESRPCNYRGAGNNVKRILLLTPLSVLNEPLFCDFIYVTELKILEKLSESYLSRQCQVIIPVEMGEFREGVPPDQLIPFMKKALVLKNIKIAGFSANFGCFREFTPDFDTINSFVECIKQAAYELNFWPDIVAIGGSSVWSLLKNNNIPKEVRHVRLGEAIFLGNDPGLKIKINGFWHDAFILENEIIEIKDKNTGTGSEFEKVRKRAVLDIGYTSCQYTGLFPIQSGIEIIGSSQDYTVIDITDAEECLCIGDSVSFFMNYKTLSMAMINPYLEKKYIRSRKSGAKRERI